MGNGHLSRCLTLAAELRAQSDSLELLFICREHEGHGMEAVRKQGFTVVALSEPVLIESERQYELWLGASQDLDASETVAAIDQHFNSNIDCLVVDHYGIDRQWHEVLRARSRRLFVIDDLADRQYDCDLLLEQTFAVSPARYRNLVGSNCKVLAGTKFAMLREEFQVLRDQIVSKRQSTARPTRIFVNMGGTDPQNWSARIIDILAKRSDLEHVTLVVGGSNPHIAALQQQTQKMNKVFLVVAADNMAELMMNHDLAIGAAGSGTWERCALGLPSLLVVSEDNQQELARQLKSELAVTVLHKDVSDQSIDAGLRPWLESRECYQKAVASCLDICDGKGAGRVSQYVTALSLQNGPDTFVEVCSNDKQA